MPSIPNVHFIVDARVSIEKRVLRSTKSPIETWRDLIHDDVSDGLQRELFFQTARLGLELEGLKFIGKLQEDFHVWSDFALVSKILDQVVQVYAVEDPRSTFEEASKLPSNSSELALEAIVSIWAVADPLGALDAVESLEKKTKRRRLQELVIFRWVQSDPQDVIEQIAAVPAYLKPFAHEQIIVELAIRDPIEAVRLMKDSSNQFTYEKHAASVLRYWMQNEPELAFAWLREEPSASEWRLAILPSLLVEYSLVDPHQAFDIGLSYGVEDQVIYGVVDYDLDLALELAKKASENNKASALSIVGERLVTQRKFDSALDLADFLHQTERDWYLDQIISTWEVYFPRALSNQINELPQTLQSRAALRLLSHHTPNVFNDQESVWLESLLDEEDRVIFHLRTTQSNVVKPISEEAGH